MKKKEKNEDVEFEVTLTSTPQNRSGKRRQRSLHRERHGHRRGIHTFSACRLFEQPPAWKASQCIRAGSAPNAKPETVIKKSSELPAEVIVGIVIGVCIILGLIFF